VEAQVFGDTGWLSANRWHILRSFYLHEHERNSSGPRHLAWGQEKAEEKSSKSREGAIVALLFVPTHVDESKTMHQHCKF
jgi:hypothetical protein